jgi:DNA-binding transcriptional ArsR family regulator
MAAQAPSPPPGLPDAESPEPRPESPRPGPNPPTSAERTALYQTLTNPVRRRIMHYIGHCREANSTSVAKALGESTGTTSYHLRKLAEQHLIEEIPERSAGRERWWRLLPVDHRPAAPGDRTSEEQSALRQLRAQQLSADIELALQAESEYAGPDGWAQGSRAGCYMTRQELLAFFDEYMGLLRKYGHDQADAPHGARLMALRFFALPDPGLQAPGPPPEQRTKTADGKEMP